MKLNAYFGLGTGLLVLSCLAPACTIVDKSDDDDSADSGTGSDDDAEGDAGADDDMRDDDPSEEDAGVDADPATEDAGPVEEGDGGDVPEGDAAAPSEFAWLDCPSRDIEDATRVEDSLDEDTTWSGTVFVEGNIDILDGVTLTIEPGTSIIMGVDSELEFGWNGGSATLKANGTEAEPITICGQEPEAGFWRAVRVRSNVPSNSVLEHVLIADGGGDGAALQLDADITIDHVQVRNADADGVTAVDFSDDSAMLSVEGSGDAPVVLTGDRAATNFPLGGAFEDNGDNVVHVAFASIDEDTVFHDPGIPYVQDEPVDVTDSSELVFEAGVEYRFAADADLEVGWNGSDPTLLVNGTESDPVVFRGATDESGHWRGIRIQSNVRSNSKMANARILHAGGDDVDALHIRSAITLENVELAQNDIGVWIGEQGLGASSANLSITETGGVPLTVEPNALISLPEGGDFSGNNSDRIAVEAGSFDVSGTVPNLGVPYLVLGDIDTLTGSSMTIAAGTHFVMSADADIEFGWNGGSAEVLATGTEEAPIRFTGLDEVAGFWQGLHVNANVLSSSKFDWVEIAHAGGNASNAAGLVLRSEIAVTNSTFSDGSGYGILKEPENTTDYETSNTFTDLELGNVGDL